MNTFNNNTTVVSYEGVVSRAQMEAEIDAAKDLFRATGIALGMDRSGDTGYHDVVLHEGVHTVGVCDDYAVYTYADGYGIAVCTEAHPCTGCFETEYEEYTHKVGNVMPVPQLLAHEHRVCKGIGGHVAPTTM